MGKMTYKLPSSHVVLPCYLVLEVARRRVSPMLSRRSANPTHQSSTAWVLLPTPDSYLARFRQQRWARWGLAGLHWDARPHPDCWLRHACTACLYHGDGTKPVVLLASEPASPHPIWPRADIVPWYCTLGMWFCCADTTAPTTPLSPSRLNGVAGCRNQHCVETRNPRGTCAAIVCRLKRGPRRG